MQDVDEATSSEPVSAESGGARERKQPERFGVADMKLSDAALRRFDKSSGERHERQPERECTRLGCVSVRTERDELRRKLEAEQNRFQQETAAMRSGLDGREVDASESLQQAMVELLDFEEERESCMHAWSMGSSGCLS